METLFAEQINELRLSFRSFYGCNPPHNKEEEVLVHFRPGFPLCLNTTGDDKDRCKWTNEETRDFLNLIYEQNITAILDNKNLTNAIIYQELVKETTNKGYDKPWDVLRSKWKGLKQRYVSQKRELSRSGARGKIKGKFHLFDELDQILGQRPIVASLDSYINNNYFRLAKLCFANVCLNVVRFSAKMNGNTLKCLKSIRYTNLIAKQHVTSLHTGFYSL